MALQKEIILKNGIPVNYHRVVSLNQITNHVAIIEIGSYLNIGEREKEKNGTTTIFISSKYMEIPYGQITSVVDVYYYLKTLEMFEGCEDV